MKRFFKLVLCVWFFNTFIPAPVNASDSKQVSKRPKIVIVLEGGGALGFAHVGVIKVLAENNIPIHGVVGTSIGSIVGAAYASGRTIEEMETALATTDWDKLFNEFPRRQDLKYRDKYGQGNEIYGAARFGLKDGSVVTPLALISGQRVELLFHDLFGKAPPDVSFDDLPVQYRAVAADLETGKAVVIDHGSLTTAARASMSVPNVFAPVDHDGKLLVDGGITNNMPVDVAIAMGADVVIAVELVSPLKKRDELTGPFAITGQILDLLLSQTTERAKGLLRPQDILLQVELTEYSAGSFKDAKAIMEIGEQSARQAVSSITHLSVQENEFIAFESKRTGGGEFNPIVEFVVVQGVNGHRKRIIEDHTNIEIGKPLDREQLESDLDNIFSGDEYEKIIYNLEEKDGKYGVVIEPDVKEWRQQTLQFGFALEDDFEGTSRYALGSKYKLTDLNTLGAEATVKFEIGRTPYVDAEWFQPLWQGSPIFIAPNVYLGQQEILVRDGDELVAEYERELKYFGLSTGLELGNFGITSVGLRRGFGDVNRRIGEPTLPEFDYDMGEVVGSFLIDRQDNPDFPTEGLKLNLTGIASRDGLGASDDFEQGVASVAYPLTFDRNTLLIGGEGGFSSSDLPVERIFSLGGYFDISGFQRGSLVASDYWIGRVVGYRRVTEVGSKLFGLGGYLGFSMEYSSLRTDFENLPDEPDLVSGSVFVGVDTPLLPAYLGYGMSDTSERTVFLLIGRIAPRKR